MIQAVALCASSLRRISFVSIALCVFSFVGKLMQGLRQVSVLSVIRKLFLISFILAANTTFSQDINYAHKIINSLTSPYFWGRGYTKDGMGKAANFIKHQFDSLGLRPMAKSGFFQTFSYPVNTFPGRMKLSINGKNLGPGKDFIISPESRGFSGKSKLQQQDSTHYTDAANRVIVSFEDKLTWSAADEVADYTLIKADKKLLTQSPKTIDAAIDNSFIQNFKASNVCALVRGTEKPDSVIVISAHYDHLGGMGAQTYFPGANDNASGTSLLLNLAKYYAANPQPFTIAFICLAGEEAGLKGSKYFIENPQIPLKNICFVLNLDLEGTGDEGITVVNATEFPKEFSHLNAANDAAKYLVKINARGKAANSDHYWFTEKGVPAFFIYTLGGIKAYHDIYDKASTLPLTEFQDLFKLIVKFNKKLMK